MPLKLQCGLAGAALLTASPALALCSYDGIDYARTTIAQEFRDSPLVVRARVITANDWATRGDRVTLYHLQVERVLKGRAGRSLTFATERNSGGFYLDAGVKPDIGGSYLLFLGPVPRATLAGWDLGRRAAGSWFINYACGQSRPWRELSVRDRALLAKLAR